MQPTAQVISDYTSAYPDPIVIHQGENVRVSHCDLQWRGWMWVTLSSGKAGWAPQQLFSPIGSHEAVCDADYSADELTVRIGETLTLMTSLNGWFWAQNASGETGWVPGECVRLGQK